MRANYEPYPGALVFTAKVYQENVLWLQRPGGPTAVPLAPSVFVNCLEKVFPYSELVANGQENQISGELTLYFVRFFGIVFTVSRNCLTNCVFFNYMNACKLLALD